MKWFEGMREGLREKRINLHGPYDLPPGEQETVRQFVGNVRELVCALGKNPDDTEMVKVRGSFLDGLERTIGRFLKGKERAYRAKLTKSPKKTEADELLAILREYQEAVAFVLQFTRGLLAANVFKQASTIAPFWQAQKLENQLSDEKIMETLQKAGVEMGAEEVKEVFTKAVRLYFVVHNISDPLEVCAKYAEGELTYGGMYYKRSAA